MTLQYHQNFLKKYSKLSKKYQQRTRERILLFSQLPYAPQLRNHPLKGTYQGYRSINITGDLRAIFKEQANGNVIFVEIGSHSELFK